MKKIILILVIIAGLFLLAGVYKFNFTNNDIYVKDSIETVIPIDETKKSDKKIKTKELKTKTGKTIFITETHPIGQSISSVIITTEHFKVNQTIELNDIDPIEKVELRDLDNDGFDELFLFTRSAGSGSAGNFYAYSSYKDEKLKTCKKEKIDNKEYSKGGFMEGFMGHDMFFFDKGLLIMEFPIYKESDTNSNPTGERGRVMYKLTNSTFKIEKKTNI
jgi:hypothetical protein